MTKYIYISGSIGTLGMDWGEVSAADVRRQIDAIRADDPSAAITVILNSYGGDVTEGIAVYNLLQATGVDVVISGMAASIASVIAMAGRRVSMYDNSTLFLHHAWTWGEGNAADFKQRTEELEAADRVLLDAYIRKSGRTEDEIRAILDGPNGDGSSIDAARALELGLIDEVLDPTQAVAALLKNHHPTHQHITSAGDHTGANKETAMSAETTPTTTPAAECGEPKQTAEETVVETETETAETTGDPTETRITELEKTVEELTAKLAEKDAKLAAQAKFRAVVASAAETAADANLDWPALVKKHGFKAAAEKFPEARKAYMKARIAAGSIR